LVNQAQTPEGRHVTNAHKQTHLYCGHIGTRNKNWWPERRGLETNITEFEAECAAYIVSAQLVLKSPAESYPFEYLDKNQEIPRIILERVKKTAGLMESIGQKRSNQEKKNKPQ
jgi:hypothetical protein